MKRYYSNGQDAGGRPEYYPQGLTALRHNVIIARALWDQGYLFAEGVRWEIIAIGDERVYVKNHSIRENQKASIALVHAFGYLQGKYRDQASSELQDAQG